MVRHRHGPLTQKTGLRRGEQPGCHGHRERHEEKRNIETVSASVPTELPRQPAVVCQRVFLSTLAKGKLCGGDTKVGAVASGHVKARRWPVHRPPVRPAFGSGLVNRRKARGRLPNVVWRSDRPSELLDIPSSRLGPFARGWQDDRRGAEAREEMRRASRRHRAGERTQRTDGCLVDAAATRTIWPVGTRHWRHGVAGSLAVLSGGTWSLFIEWLAAAGDGWMRNRYFATSYLCE